MPRLLAMLAALLLVACGGAVSSAPSADAPPESGACASVAGLGCACGAASGVWRCVGEMPVCVCAVLDAAPMDVPPLLDAAEERGADPAACLGPCAVNADCATACRVSVSDPSIYCCLDGRCVAGQRACADFPGLARLCVADSWSPVCTRSADCLSLCGAGWFCARPATGIARCVPLESSDGGADVAHQDTEDASRGASDVPRDLPCTGTACSGRCVDTARDPSNCGACGVGCPSAANADPACALGGCALACRAGFADCDGRASNGCEADLSTPAYCGACATMCREHVGCVAGACAGCVEHFGDCDRLAANGCEADLRYDAFNCGGCGRRCPGSCYASVCR